MGLFPTRDLLLSAPTLQTPRLKLRKLGLSDAANLFDVCKNPRVSRFVLWDYHMSIQETRSYLRMVQRAYREDECAPWGIQFEGRIIGTIGFVQVDRRSGIAEVGYSLGEAYWNKGLATEALKAVLRFGMGEGNLERIEAMHDVRNPASGAVMKKSGMHMEGVLRRRVFLKGEWADVALYAIVRGDVLPL